MKNCYNAEKIYKNRNLTEYGFPEDVIYDGGRNMEESDQWITGKESDVAKLEKEGDQIQGTFIEFQPSTIYKDTWALHFIDNEQPKVCFVTKIAVHLFVTNGIEKGYEFILKHAGKKKTSDGKHEYHTYSLQYRPIKA